MKKIFLALLFFGFALQSQSQKLAPVKWAYQAVKTGDKKYNVIITANVDAPWHIYSQFVKKGAVIGSFGGKVQFIQAVTLKVNTKTKLTGTIEYMVCNEERCLPPTKQSFEVDIQ